jgi:hypothetical protein
VFSKVDTEGVLLDTRSGVYFGLNETGSLLWSVLEGGSATLDDLRASLVSAFEAVPDSLAADLEAWVLEMKEHDLLEVV